MQEKFEKFELEVSTLEVKPNLIKSDGPEVVTGDGKKSKIRILINVDDDNDNSPIFIPSKSSTDFYQNILLTLNRFRLPKYVRDIRSTFIDRKRFFF